ncbi:MAG: aminotransferase class V-fold PLP-dependent enzyme [Bacteroidota bacterium]
MKILSTNDPKPSEFAQLWPLDPKAIFLNHGSFGACTRFILDKQTQYRQQLENQPVRFLAREMEPLFDHSRQKVAQFVKSRGEDLVFVQNATAGVNTVFRSLRFNPGDEILYTNHIYGACKRLLEYISEQTGARLVEVVWDFPISSSDLILDAILKKVTSKTRIALIDHISSATALIHPVEAIVSELEKRGVDTMIDGAHALGSIPLDIEKIGAAYYTANCHKWLCAPKSVAILHIRSDKQVGIVPVVISHAGYNAEPFAERFFWPGTYDPTAALCVADTIDYMESIFPGGWLAIMKRNHDLCLQAREYICNILEIEIPCPGSMIASMATFPLPMAEEKISYDYKNFDPLQERLFREFNIEIPVWDWYSPPSRLTRIAVQLYNSIDQYKYFAAALLKAICNNRKNRSGAV